MLAIHNCPGSFSERWLSYCGEREITHKVVNCHATDIIAQLRGVSALLWHWSHVDPTDQICARQLIRAVEDMGIYVYPNTRTCWHYDDKLGQKFLLEALGAPLVPSYVFFDQGEGSRVGFPRRISKGLQATVWSGFNKCPAGRKPWQAEGLCRRAFSRGFKPAASYFSDFSTRATRTKGLKEFAQKLFRAPSNIKSIWAINRVAPRQRGYVYFQDYVPGNTHDTRVTIIGERAFAFRRKVRPGDFRASGSGSIDWSPEQIDSATVATSFEITRRIGAQSLAFDYVHDQGGNPKVVEISYTFMAEAVYRCPGWWDKGTDWHPGHLWPQDAIIEDVLALITRAPTTRIHGECQPKLNVCAPKIL